MRSKGLALLVVGVLGLFVISGCETVPKKMREDVSGIKDKVNTLETRVDTVESKQADVERATAAQSQAIEEMKTVKEVPGARTNVSVKSRGESSKERTKDIQSYLKNAGFYGGMVDGVKGTATRKAIKDFQSANGLKPDGVVGPKTWELLCKYESGAAAPAGAGGQDEGIK